jgi:hypothetical protein
MRVGRGSLLATNSEGPVGEMAANESTGRSATTAPPAGPDPGQVPTNGASTRRRISVVVGLLLLPMGAVVLACAPLLRASDWAGAVFVVAGTAALAVGIGLVSAPAHAEHVRSYRRTGRTGPDRGDGGTG